MDREGFIFYRSYAEALADLEQPETELELYRAIVQYGCTGAMPELSGVAKAMMRLIKPQLDANIRRYENGRRPKSKQTASETEAKQKQDTSKAEAKPEVSEAKEKEKEKEKVKVKEKVKEKEEKAVTPSLTPSPTFAFGSFMNVILTGEQEKELFSRYGREQTDKYIERLSAYMANNNKTYKDHYRTLLSWMRQDNVKSSGGAEMSELMSGAIEKIGGRSA